MSHNKCKSHDCYLQYREVCMSTISGQKLGCKTYEFCPVCEKEASDAIKKSIFPAQYKNRIFGGMGNTEETGA